MPLGAARITLLAKTQVTAVAEVIRRKVGISAVGDAKVSTAQSVFGGASALFDGTGDFLVSGPTSNFGFGTGDFTLEARVRFNSLILQAIINARQASGGFFGNVMALNNQRLAWSNGSVFVQGTTVLTTGVFYHLAISRQSGNLRFWIDGVSDLNVTDNANVGTAQRLISVGAFEQGSNPINGHIDEVRISNIARYTAGFTPSTTPFTNDANTLLLLHMDGTNNSTFFEDDNGVRAPVGMTATGGAIISTSRSKFGGSSWNGSSSSTATMLLAQTPYTFGTGDFTIECFASVELDFGSTSANIFSMGTSINDANNYRLTVGAQINNFGLRLGSISYQSTFIWSLDVFYHLAVVRTNGVVSLYIDGVKDTSIGTNGNIAFSTDLEERYLGIGRITYHPVRAFPGYIDELRVSNTARYTAAFTPSTTPFVNDSNTLLLLHMDGTATSGSFGTVFRDDVGVRAPLTMRAIGDAQVSTAQSVFGGASAVFDGTGDFLVSGLTSNFGFGTGDFTLEARVRFNSVATLQAIINARQTINSVNASVMVLRNQRLAWSNGSIYVQGNAPLTTGVFYHLAISRQSGNLRFWIDGVLDLDVTDNANVGTAQRLISVGAFEQGSDPINGHIDEVRISNSARYTATFTPATQPHVNDANTLLLLHMDGTNGSTTFTDDNGVIPFTPT